MDLPHRRLVASGRGARREGLWERGGHDNFAARFQIFRCLELTHQGESNEDAQDFARIWPDFPPAAGVACHRTGAAYCGNYRYEPRPGESMSLGRNFRIKEKATLPIRGEFTNIFNRTEANNPTASNAWATQTRNAAGQTTAGFGFINGGDGVQRSPARPTRGPLPVLN